MSNELQKFNFEGQDLSIKEVDGQVYFNAEQAAIGLGISDVAKVGISLQDGHVLINI